MNATQNVDRKGIFWFLVLTFVSTYLVELVMLRQGFSFAGVPPIAGQMVVAGVMFFPGISAYIVRRFITREGFKDAGMRIGEKKHYLYVYLLVPLLFAAIYALTWAFVDRPDFTLAAFLKQYGMPELPIPAGTMILGIFLATITFAPFLNSIPAFGEEYGWRGYLLPKLLPLGTRKALILSGIIWGLWHAPLIMMGYRYGNYHAAGILFFTVLLVFLGIYIGYLRLVSDSVVLAAFAHGTFNAQAYGIWTMLNPTTNPLAGGFSGVPGILVFAILSLWIFSRLPARRETQGSPGKQQPVISNQ